MNKMQSHLEMIQNIINRLSQNSFLLKGWSVVLVSALCALSQGTANIVFMLLALFPVLAFWFLDAYFLRQERLFRKLFDKVRLMKEKDIDFSMSTLSIEKDVDSTFQIISSKTMLGFHGVVFLSVIVAMLLYIAIK